MDHWVLDWALIKLDPNRFTFEQLQNIPLPSSCAMFETNLDAEGWKETGWTPRAKDVAAPTKGSSYLFKIGRTTGHTVGRFHDVDASVTINYIVDGPDGKQNVLVKGKALAVRRGHSEFASCGDSGALVLNGHAEAVGMVMAVADQILGGARRCLRFALCAYCRQHQGNPSAWTR
ncbi:hypothetical protein B0H67DRAFT_109 [Lasiosphaeris hirsuta]|uniref:Peptidase S1 domain-containing protein n=1 Tax=Lasiosphaeris hirsuta TaxID=260670 RepID=A0AA40B868_9PEZI|nr:hypothetical protein B0H67DRAFT_109 [Lasiosphaeris hirsuta]